MIAMLATHERRTIPAQVDSGGPFGMNRPAYEQEVITFGNGPPFDIQRELLTAGFVPYWQRGFRVWVRDCEKGQVTA